MPEAARPSPESETRLLRTAQERGILSPEQVEEALRTRRTLGETGIARAIEDVLFEKGVFTPGQVRAYRQLASETVPVSEATALPGWERTAPAAMRPGVEAPPDEHPGEPFGRYRLEVKLGHGGMGVVWRAWDTELRRVVALKQILGDASHGQAIERFLREARAAARLRHPGIVSVHDVGVIDGKHYLTADFVEGTSLDKRLREGMSTRDAVALVKGVAEALQYAHDQGIVHRDIKPGNILIDRSGAPHVADFGLAKDANPGSGPALTVSGDLLGTPSYMSPEQARGRPDEQGPASDQFSLGVMLYEMVAGRLPFQGTSLQDILNAITDSDPVAPSRFSRKLHADVETVILKLLEKDPSKRYPSMRDLGADLGRILEAEPIEARRPGVASRWMRRAVKHRGLSVTALLALLGIGTLGWFVWRQRTEGAAQEVVRLKTERVQAVLLRWGGLSEAVRELQENAWDESLPTDQRRERNRRAWAEIAQFMRDTPGDATSQSTVKALAGWARVLEGHEAEGLAWLTESRRLDPDVPFGALLHGLLLLTDYCKAAPVPRPRFSQLQEDKQAPEGQAQRERRERIAALTAESSRARVRAGELSSGLEATLQSLDDVRADDFQRAERAMASALGSGAMQWCRIPLLLWRALIRRRLRSFEGALDDLAQIERACPRWQGIPYLRGLVYIEEGLAAFDRQEPTDGPCQKAVASLTTAAETPSQRERALVARAGAHVLLAESKMVRGLDPRASWELALIDFAAAAADPASTGARHLEVALLRITRGNWLSTHGGDPIPEWEAGISELGHVIQANPGSSDALWRRGAARSNLAYLRMGTGTDTRPDQRLAIEDIERALALEPENPEMEHGAGLAWLRLAEEEQTRGGDEVAAARKALDHSDAVLRRLPDDVDSLLVRGCAWIVLAQGEMADQVDPRPSLKRAADVLRMYLAKAKSPDPSVPGRLAVALHVHGSTDAECGGDSRGLWESARQEALKAVTVAPGDLRALVILASMYLHAGELKNAAEACRKLAAAAPGNAQIEAAREQITGLLAEDRETPRVGWKRTAWLARDAMAHGEFPRARILLEDALAAAPSGEELDASGRETVARLHFDLARIHARLSQPAGRRHAAPFDIGDERRVGHRDAAISLLEKAIDLGWNEAWELEVNADLEPLRADPRWAGLVGSLPKR